MPAARVRNAHGHEIDFNAASRLMDAALLDQLKSKGDYADEQAFFEAYAQAHVRKFSQSFAPFTGGRW